MELLKKLIDKGPELVEKAGINMRSFMAFVIFLLAVTALALFFYSPDNVRLTVFVLLLFGIFWFVILLFKHEQPKETVKEMLENSLEAFLKIPNDWERERMDQKMQSHILDRERMSQKNEPPITVPHLRNLWNNLDKGLSDGSLISINGTLSKYAPMLVGFPYDKRELHRSYRRAIPEDHLRAGKTYVDANLAYTSGQMVIRFDFEDKNWVCLGLYHSIVRNSVPLLVNRNYYNKEVEPLFKKGSNPYVIEAKVTARLRTTVNKSLNEFISRNKLTDLIGPEIIRRSGERNIMLEIPDEPECQIEYLDEPRYLDGDIWVAVEKDGCQSFVTRFLNLADIDDLKNEINELRKDVKEYHPNNKIVFQFDQKDKIFAEEDQSINLDELKSRFMN